MPNEGKGAKEDVKEALQSASLLAELAKKDAGGIVKMMMAKEMAMFDSCTKIFCSWLESDSQLTLNEEFASDRVVAFAINYLDQIFQANKRPTDDQSNS